MSCGAYSSMMGGKKALKMKGGDNGVMFKSVPEPIILAPVSVPTVPVAPVPVVSGGKKRTIKGGANDVMFKSVPGPLITPDLVPKAVIVPDAGKLVVSPSVEQVAPIGLPLQAGATVTDSGMKPLEGGKKKVKSTRKGGKKDEIDGGKKKKDKNTYKKKNGKKVGGVLPTPEEEAELERLLAESESAADDTGGDDDYEKIEAAAAAASAPAVARLAAITDMMNKPITSEGYAAETAAAGQVTANGNQGGKKKDKKYELEGGKKKKDAKKGGKKDDDKKELDGGKKKKDSKKGGKKDENDKKDDKLEGGKKKKDKKKGGKKDKSPEDEAGEALLLLANPAAANAAVARGDDDARKAALTLTQMDQLPARALMRSYGRHVPPAPGTNGGKKKKEKRPYKGGAVELYAKQLDAIANQLNSLMA